MRKANFILLLAAVGAWPALAAPPAPLKAEREVARLLQPHALVYEITLREALERSGLVAASGMLTSRLRGSPCEGWTSDSRMQVRFVFRRLGVRETDTRVSSWESDDGNIYLGILQRTLNGRLMESYRVKATRPRPGVPFTLRMSEPELREAELPAATLFPTGALKRVLAAARAGQHSLSLLLYEGDEEMAPQQVVVTIGQRRMPLAATAQDGASAGQGRDEQESDDLQVLARTPYWPVSMAYYGPLKEVPPPRADDDEAAIRAEARRRGVPDYEVSFRLYENGITGNAQLIYDDYTLEARVVRLQLLPRDRCE